MNSVRGVAEPAAEGRASMGFGTWFAVTFLAHAIGMAIFVGLWGALILGIPIRSLVVPYALLAGAGFALSPLLYWVRSAHRQPQLCSQRLGIALFGYLLVLTLDLGIGAVRLGIVSEQAAIHEYAPALIPFAAVASLASYFLVRRVLEGKSGR